MSDTVVLPSSPVQGPLAGDVIAGKYRLERELGRGAMGTVWSAMHTTLGQRVAIKLIAGDQSRSAEARHRFGVEAKAAARLRSRHVVQVYDDGETTSGTPYIVMEYLEGQTLEERLDGQHDLGLAEAVRITSHVGRALARAHAQGVVHRDLKSGNIFLAKSEDDELGWVAKVLDFGVAKVLTDVIGPSATKTGTIVGTPLFMSPEQIRGASHVDHRADLYSLGMVFYNMVTGSHAFDGPSYSDVLVAICTEVLPDIRIAAPWLPPPLGVWFDKACARERERRFQSADEMIEALQDAAGPAARMTRPSAPEEVAGPSGTLVGHVPPHAAATILAGDFGDIPSSLAAPRAAGPGSTRLVGPASSGAPARPEGTLRSNPTAPRTNTDPNVPAAPVRSNLWLWAASGVGLALATMALILAAGRSGPAPSDASTKLEPTRAEAAAPGPVEAPIPLPPERTAPIANPPATPPPHVASTPTPPNESLRAADAARNAAHSARASEPPRSRPITAPARRAAPVLATQAPSPAGAPRPASAAAAPDMGF